MTTLAEPIVAEVVKSVIDKNIDLKRRIETEIVRGANQFVRATKITYNTYRVNWFETIGHDFIQTNKIVKSKFLKVTDNGSELEFVDSGVTNGRA